MCVLQKNKRREYGMILSLIIGILTLVAEWMIFKKMGRQG